MLLFFWVKNGRFTLQKYRYKDFRAWTFTIVQRIILQDYMVLSLFLADRVHGNQSGQCVTWLVGWTQRRKAAHEDTQQQDPTIQPPTTDAGKVCKKCDTYLVVAAFALNQSYSDGRHNICRACDAERVRLS